MDVKCPSCQTMFSAGIVDPAGMHRMTCPICHTRFEINFQKVVVRPVGQDTEAASEVERDDLFTAAARSGRNLSAIDQEKERIRRSDEEAFKRQTSQWIASTEAPIEQEAVPLSEAGDTPTYEEQPLQARQQDERDLEADRLREEKERLAKEAEEVKERDEEEARIRREELEKLERDAEERRLKEEQEADRLREEKERLAKEAEEVKEREKEEARKRREELENLEREAQERRLKEEQETNRLREEKERLAKEAEEAKEREEEEARKRREELEKLERETEEHRKQMESEKAQAPAEDEAVVSSNKTWSFAAKNSDADESGRDRLEAEEKENRLRQERYLNKLKDEDRVRQEEDFLLREEIAIIDTRISMSLAALLFIVIALLFALSI